MRIQRAKKMGFCFGVSGAVELCEDIALNNAKDYKNIYILGMLVHNKAVIQDMKDMGYNIISEEEVLKEETLTKEDLIIIRAHGTTKDIYNKLHNSGAKIYDATCVFVKKIKEALVEAERHNREIIFIGDINHPEVKGIVSFGKNIHVFPSYDTFLKFQIKDDVNYTLLTQTTFNKEEFFKIKDFIVANYTNIEIFSKICGATYERQQAVEEIAKTSDIVLIIGDITSSNSKKLKEISMIHNPRSYMIQHFNEIDPSWFNDVEIVGITAGASTPEKLIIEIEKYIRGNFDDKHGL